MRVDSFHPNQWFDKFLTYCRYQRVYKSLFSRKDVNTVYDLGCGSGNLVNILRQKGYSSYGVDVKAGEHILAADLNHPLPIETESVDFITSLANIEHLNEPQLNLNEIYRILRKGGTLVLTTPSTAAKPVLEFLAFKLKLIDPTEILDHKMYFSKSVLESYLKKAGFSQFHINRFQCGMNLHAIATK